jgi:hypothetical protein
MGSLIRKSWMLLAVWLALAAPTGAPAQEGGWSAKEAAELKGYTLTMDKLRRASEATAALEQLGNRADEDENESASLDAMVERINSVPQARAILARHKLTAREYALTMVTGAHAASVAELEAAGHRDPGTLPVSRAQVEFYQANKAEIDVMFARQRAQAEESDEEEE